MKFGSLFSGIGGFDLAFKRAGFECAWQCEIDKACQSVLKKHFTVRIYDDVRSINKDNAEPVDLICGGFPCQDLSVAGKRAGLAGERSGLWFEFARVIGELAPRWVFIENVPGLLSSNRGRDFGIILDQLVKFGYGVAWRVLDAQYFGLAQRRKRVFIVGSLRNGRAAEVLFERECNSWDTPPGREKRKNSPEISGTLASNGGGLDRPAGNGNELDFCIPIAGTLSARTKAGGFPGTDEAIDGYLTLMAFGENNTSGPIDVATAVPTRRYDFESETFIAFSAGQSASSFGLAMDENVTPPIRAGESGTNRVPTIAFDTRRSTFEINKSTTLNPGGGGFQSPSVSSFTGIRRLTPTECERLQGFPDGWTAGQSDSARYRQLGNAVAVPVVEWIVRRITSD